MKEGEFPVKRALGLALPLALSLSLAACAATPQPAAVTFAPEMRVIAAAQTQNRALYDLTLPPELSEHADAILGQSYAMLGREDLTAQSSDEYLPASCSHHPSGAMGEDTVLDAIVAAAAQARVVIVNESHVVSRHRGFSAALAERLRPLGFTHFGAETFDNDADPPPVLASFDLTYPRDVDGTYSREAGFGRLIRTVERLGYVPFAYEDNVDRDRSASRDQQIAWREAFQAQAIADMLAALGPEARLLIHAGYMHARETPVEWPDGREDHWMAMRLKRDHGIDPLTISQYQCRDESGPVRLAGTGRDAPEGAFDFVVAHPVTTFVNHRPVWRDAIGDIRVPVPQVLVPSQGAHVIEARPVGEPDAAIPMDRVLVYPGESVDLLLPPGRYRLRAVVALTHAPG